MTINATIINIFHICHREMWLHHHAIRMEHTSEVVYEGKLIGELPAAGRQKPRGRN
jgi:CRISPR-associated exonuclease Cas4